MESRNLQSLGEVEVIEWRPAGFERGFHVFVDLPEDYASTQERFPAVYLLDGGNTLPLVAAYHHYLRFGNEAPALLLVGISYGADTFREGNWRLTDYTAPSATYPFWGGAPVFRDLLEKELLPLVERRYRADPARRILFGHSIGGQFVLYTALTRPDLFSGLIACSPALHENLPFFLAWQGEGPFTAASGRLFVALAENEADPLAGPIRSWLEHWQSQPQIPWLLESRVLPGQTHLSGVAECFGQGLRWLQPPPGP